MSVGYLLLKYQMGINLDQPVELTESLDGVIEKAAVETLLDQKFVLENHVDYRLISSQERMKTLSLQNEKAPHYPTLNGFLMVQETAQRNDFPRAPEVGEAPARQAEERVGESIQ